MLGGAFGISRVSHTYYWTKSATKQKHFLFTSNIAVEDDEKWLWKDLSNINAENSAKT